MKRLSFSTVFTQRLSTSGGRYVYKTLWAVWVLSLKRPRSLSDAHPHTPCVISGLNVDRVTLMDISNRSLDAKGKLEHPVRTDAGRTSKIILYFRDIPDILGCNSHCCPLAVPNPLNLLSEKRWTVFWRLIRLLVIISKNRLKMLLWLLLCFADHYITWQTAPSGFCFLYLPDVQLWSRGRGYTAEHWQGGL